MTKVPTTVPVTEPMVGVAVSKESGFDRAVAVARYEAMAVVWLMTA